MLKRIVSIGLLFIICFCVTVPTTAAATDSYTRIDVPGEQTEYRLSREMYIADTEISATSLGLSKPLEGIIDICSCKDGSVLVLCGDDSCLLRVNSDYTFNSEISVTDDSGATVDFSGAKGVYSDDKGNIYIADTLNARVLVTDNNGRLKNILTKPDSNLIPSDFLYQPVCVSKDLQGYTYILSFGCFYGALLYSPSGEFLGFYGANTVKASALDTLSYLWDKLVGNDIKKSASVKTLPYSFVDFDFDSEGYMVTCTGNTSEDDNGKGQIRKISPNGSDIMYKRTLKGETVLSSAVNFLEDKLIIRQKRTGNYVVQNIVSVAVSDDNYIFCLDRTNGTIYLYDSECNLMSAFGGGLGQGNQLGVFNTPVSIALNGDSVWVADSESNSITVFNPTEYGKVLRKAQSLYLKGDYGDSKSLWEKVLSYDRNNQLAYRGLAMIYYNNKDYDKALETAKIAADYTVYDLAWQAILSQFFADNFIWIIGLAVLIIGLIAGVSIYLYKHNKRLIKNTKVKLLLQTPFHPFRCFDDLKYRKLGSVKLAIIITLLFYVSNVLKETASGFLFTDSTARNYNSLYTLIATVGLLLLWSVCNWLVCSMFSGKGSLKEVYVSSSYTILPLIIFTFIRTIATNFLSLSSADLINGLEIALLIYTFFLLCVAMMTIHEYDFFKFLLTGIVTVLFMILVVFVLFMCAILLKQLVSFLYSLYSEFAYR